MCQVYYSASRKLIVKGVDGVVFVADSQIERMEANVESMQNLYDNLLQHGYDLTRIPFAVQTTNEICRMPPRWASSRTTSIRDGRPTIPGSSDSPRTSIGRASFSLIRSTAPGSSELRISRRWPAAETESSIRSGRSASWY